MVNHNMRTGTLRAPQQGSLAAAVIASPLTALPDAATAAPARTDAVPGAAGGRNEVGPTGSRQRPAVSVRDGSEITGGER